MAGFAYVAKDLTTRMMTSQCLFDCPDQYKKLRIRTGTEPTATIGYGLTTDTTASVSSPAIMYTNNKICYLGTYSTERKEDHSTYPVIVDWGYTPVPTKTIPIVERRHSDGWVDVEVDTTVNTTTRYETHPAYYSQKSLYTYRTTTYRSSFNKDNPHEPDILGGWVENPKYDHKYYPFSFKDPKEAYANVDPVGYIGKYIGTSRTDNLLAQKTGGGKKSTIEVLIHDPDMDECNIATRYYTASSWYTSRESRCTVLYGYVESYVEPHVTTTQTTTMTQSEVHGEYDVTVGYSYEYIQSYWEVTSEGVHHSAYTVTHSNINVI